MRARLGLRHRRLRREHRRRHRRRRSAKRAVRDHFPRPADRAGRGRAADRRGHEPPRPTVGDGDAAGGNSARTVGAGVAVARLAARDVPTHARAKGDARRHVPVRDPAVAAADRDGDRPRARSQGRARRAERLGRRRRGAVRLRLHARSAHAGDAAPASRPAPDHLAVPRHRLVNLVSIATSVLGTALFLVASLTIGRRVVFFLIRWVNDNFESDFPVITTILVIMGVMALTTHFIGVHTVLGAFVAGVLIGESPILAKHIDEQLRGMILAFFMPVFLGTAGLSADLTVLTQGSLALMAVGLIAIASVGKFAGAFIGGAIGGLTRREAFALGCGMNARGSTEVIVASIGLSMGALNQNLFTLIVTMAVVTTLAMPPMLRWALGRVRMSKAEKQRLEREEFETRGFVSNLERLLLAVDQSPNGKFAARLAGLLAGPRGIPITVLPLSGAEGGKDRTPAADASGERTEAAVKATAEDTARTRRQADDEPVPIDVTVRKLQAESGEAVAKEAKKGYGLLFVGVENTRAKDGTFDRQVTRIANAFDGPLAIVATRGAHLQQPERSTLRILVPVSGTDVSRRAAEVAIAMGVGRRPGDKLFFGDTAAAVLEREPASVVFIAS